MGRTRRAACERHAGASARVRGSGELRCLIYARGEPMVGASPLGIKCYSSGHLTKDTFCISISIFFFARWVHSKGPRAKRGAKTAALPASVLVLHRAPRAAACSHASYAATSSTASAASLAGATHSWHSSRHHTRDDATPLADRSQCTRPTHSGCWQWATRAPATGLRSAQVDQRHHARLAEHEIRRLDVAVRVARS